MEGFGEFIEYYCSFLIMLSTLSNSRIAIGESKNMFNAFFMKELVPGFVNEFTIKPTKTKANRNIKNVSPLHRNCRFDDELPEDMVLFQKYSPTGCRFECMFQFR